MEILTRHIDGLHHIGSFRVRLWLIAAHLLETRELVRFPSR